MGASPLNDDTSDRFRRVFPSPDPDATVTVGGVTLRVVVARSPTQWAYGLTAVSAGSSMLFDVPADSTFTFHHAGIPETVVVAFFDPEGALVDLGVLGEGVGWKRPRSPYRYALEVPIRNTDAVMALLQDNARLVIS